MRVFVTRRGGGVHLVPQALLEGLRDGYRPATAHEVAAWYRARGQRPPACVLEQAATGALPGTIVFSTSDVGRRTRVA